MSARLFKRRGLSLERLEVLARVAQKGSLAAAATHDPVRQSQYSRQLRELESFFECALTVRAGGRLQMSEAGKDLAQIVQTFLQSLESFSRRQRDQRGRLRLGGLTSCQLASDVLPRLKSLLKQNRIDCSIETLVGDTLFDRLQNFSIDIGFFIGSCTLPGCVETARFAKRRYALFMPSSWSIGEDLNGPLRTIPVVQVHNGFAQWQKLPMEATVQGSCSSDFDAATWIRAGLAAAVLDSAMEAWMPGEEVTKVDLIERVAHYEVHLAWYPRALEVNPDIERAVRLLRMGQTSG